MPMAPTERQWLQCRSSLAHVPCSSSKGEERGLKCAELLSKKRDVLPDSLVKEMEAACKAEGVPVPKPKEEAEEEKTST